MANTQVGEGDSRRAGWTKVGGGLLILVLTPVFDHYGSKLLNKLDAKLEAESSKESGTETPAKPAATPTESVYSVRDLTMIGGALIVIIGAWQISRRRRLAVEAAHAVALTPAAHFLADREAHRIALLERQEKDSEIVLLKSEIAKLKQNNERARATIAAQSAPTQELERLRAELSAARAELDEAGRVTPKEMQQLLSQAADLLESRRYKLKDVDWTAAAVFCEVAIFFADERGYGVIEASFRFGVKEWLGEGEAAEQPKRGDRRLVDDLVEIFGLFAFVKAIELDRTVGDTDAHRIYKLKEPFGRDLLHVLTVRSKFTPF